MSAQRPELPRVVEMGMLMFLLAAGTPGAGSLIELAPESSEGSLACRNQEDRC